METDFNGWQLFNAGPFPAVVSRLHDDRIIAVNANASAMVQIPAAGLVGRHVTDFYADPRQRTALVERLTRDRRVDDVLLQFSTPGGGRARWARESSRVITVSGESAILSCFTDVTDQVAAEQALHASEQRLAEQSAALADLTAHGICHVPCFEARLAQLFEVAAETLKAERISMWRFDDDRMAIHCLDLYSRSARRHESGAVLPRRTAPAYFDALERERFIVADDAREDPRTREFADGYLEPMDIRAMLDVPLRGRATIVGVVCVEHVCDIRKWKVDERNFTMSVANLAMAAMADDARETGGALADERMHHASL